MQKQDEGAGIRMMEKRKLLISALATVFAWPLILSAADTETASLQSNESLFRTGPYLQQVTETGCTVMWMTHVKCHSWVEWGETDGLGNKAQAVVDGQVVLNNELNRIRITGLEPGKKYFYRICSREVIHIGNKAQNHRWGRTEQSAVHSFVTADPQEASLKCIFFNDLHNNLDLFQTLACINGVQGYQLSIFNGDCFNDPPDEETTLQLLRAYNGGVHASDVPVIYLRGNHEIRGAYSRQWPSLTDNPDGRQYFALSRGPVRFVFLDCGEDKEDAHNDIAGLNDFEGFHREQAEWLQTEIERPEFRNAKYRVLVHHIPIYGIREDWFQPWKTLWGPILNQAGFDLSIHGHTHRTAVHPPLGIGDHHYPMVIGGGARRGTGRAGPRQGRGTRPPPVVRRGAGPAGAA